MKGLRLVSIDCWNTILMDREEWSEAIFQVLRMELTKHVRVPDESVIRSAYAVESLQFANRLRDECVSISSVQRVDTIARSLGVRLPTGEMERISSLIDSLIFRPLPDLHPGVESFLVAVADRRAYICVVSNTGWLSGKAIRGALQHRGVTRYVDLMIFSDSASCAKPCKQIFESAMQALGCSPGECVHIGDTIGTDIKGALGVGMNAVHLRSLGEPSGAGEYVSFNDFASIWDYLGTTFEWIPR